MASRPIKISIIGDDSNLKRSLKSASKSVNRFGKNIAKMGLTAGAAFGGVATAVAVSGVKAFAEFEKGLGEVLTLLPEAGEETFKELSDQVKDFSKEFGVLPDKAIPALYSALSAGVPKDNVFEFMEVAQMAAKGGVTELETAVDALSSVVNAYGAESISAAESSDLLLTAVRLGKTTFEELAAEIYKVAPIASSVGVPFENLTASIAVLTSQGVPTAQSATMLKGALAELAKEGTKADTAFREFAGEGLATFLEGGGTFEEAIMGLAEQADTAGVSVLDLFGSVEAGQAILSLTSDGGEAFSSVLEEMGNSAGATQAAYEVMDSTMGASFDRIKSNLAVLAIDIGEKVAPLVAKATDFILEGFEELKVLIPRIKATVLEWAEVIRRRVTPHIEKFRTAISKVVKWVRTFIKENPHSALAALGVLVAAVVVPAVLALVAGFIALFSPAILIVAALAALAAGAVYAYEHFETFRDIVDTVRDWLVNTFWPAMIEVAEGIRDAFWVVVKFFRDDFVPIVENVVETMTDVWTTFSEFFSDNITPILKATVEGLIEVFKSIWTAVEGVYLALKGLFTGDMALLWDGLKQMVEGVVLAIIDLFVHLPMKIGEAARPLVGILSGIADKFSTWLVDKIVGFISAVPGKIAEFMSVVAADMLRLGKDIGGWIIDGIVGAISGAAGAIWDAIKSIIPGLDDIGGIFGDVWGGVKGIFQSARTKLNAPWGAGEMSMMGGALASPWPQAQPGSSSAWHVPGQRDFIGSAGAWQEWEKTLPGGRISKGFQFIPDVGEPPDALIPDATYTGSNINLTVNAGLGTDGNQVGDQIVTALKQWERNNGSLPLNVSAH